MTTYKKDFVVNVTAEGPGVAADDMGTIAVIGIDEIEPTRINTNDGFESIDDKMVDVVNLIFTQVPQPREIIVVGADSIVAGYEKLLESELGFTFVVPTINEELEELSEMATERIIFADVSTEEDLALFADNELHNVFGIASDHGNVAGGLAVIMSRNFGGKTAKYKQIKGAKAGNSLDVEGINIAEYKKVMGVAQITNSKLNDGNYLDLELGSMWIKRTLEQKLMNLALKNDKIPYDNNGIGMIVGAVNEVMQDANARGIVSKHRTDYRKIEDVSEEDKQARDYSHVHVTATILGAIESGEVNVKLTYSEVSE